MMKHLGFETKKANKFISTKDKMHKSAIAKKMAKCGDDFNLFFFERLQINPSDQDSLFYFEHVRDLEMYFKIRALRSNLNDENLHPALDSVLRSLQTGIAVYPDDPEGGNIIPGRVVKGRCDDAYSLYLLPLAIKLQEKKDIIEIAQYADADGTPSLDLINILDKAHVKAKVLSSDSIRELHFVYTVDNTGDRLVGIFNNQRNLIQIKYKGKSYLPKPERDGKRVFNIPQTMEQLNIFKEKKLCYELNIKLKSEYKKDKYTIVERKVITSKENISFEMRDLFTEHKTDAEIVTVINLLQLLPKNKTEKILRVLCGSIKEGAYLMVARMPSDSKLTKKICILQKQNKKLKKINGDCELFDNAMESDSIEEKL